jgi:aminoglycoside phosphotransferase (APT) family kinase protein
MVARGQDVPSAAVPDWVTATLGLGLSDVARLPWGFTNETWGATSPTGERYAATRMVSERAAAFVLRSGPEIARRLAAAKFDAPVPDDARSAATSNVVVSSWIDGTPAMLRLDGFDGAAEVGRGAGLAWRRLAAVDVAGLALDDTWARPVALAAAAKRWLGDVQPELTATTQAAAEHLIAAVASAPAEAPGPGRATFVHGDFVPANLLLREGDVALLDLEAVRIGDPLLDAAWFRWIVAYHHPDLAAAAWSAFAGAAGLDHATASQAAGLSAYPVLRILEILGDQELQPLPRRRWLVQLDAAVARAEAL